MSMTLAFLCDLDGCIANDSERWKKSKAEEAPLTYVPMDSQALDWNTYFDPDNILQDGVNTELADALKSAYHKQNIQIVYLTGRPDRTREATEQWLKEHQLDFHIDLIMRNDGDHSSALRYKSKAIQSFLELNPDIQFIFGFTDRQEDIEAYSTHDIPGMIVEAYPR